MDLFTAAETHILPPKNATKTRFESGDTNNIISVILDCDANSQADTAAFAPYLKGKNNLETCRSLWWFVKRNIAYKEDPSGLQWVKTPAATWSSKFCDCKGYAIFIMSCLKNLGIAAKYRFVSFGADSVTHVYVVTNEGIILDCCLKKFNHEKPYKFKKDFMTKIMEISGLKMRQSNPHGRRMAQVAIPRVKNYKRGDLNMVEPTEGSLELAIMKQRTELEQGIVNGISGRNCRKCQRYQNRIDVINDAIEAIGAADPEAEMSHIIADAEAGIYNNVGKSKSQRAQAKTTRKENRTKAKAEGKKPLNKLKSKGAQLLKKAAQGAKKGLKTLAKVVTAPMRLATKGILEVTLPKTAPFFLYLFISDPAVIAKLPAKVKKKRAKAEKIANFIVKVIGMKRQHFMGIVRNGIIKKYKRSPETVIAEAMRGKNVAGIGVAAAVAMEALPMLLDLLKTIASIFAKKADKSETPTASDSPNPETDFTDLTQTETTALASDVKRQSENFTPGETSSNADIQTDVLRTQTQPDEFTPENVDSPNPDGNIENLGEANNKSVKTAAQGDDAGGRTRTNASI